MFHSVYLHSCLLLLPNKETASRLVCDVHEYLWEYFPLHLSICHCLYSISLTLWCFHFLSSPAVGVEKQHDSSFKVWSQLLSLSLVPISHREVMGRSHHVLNGTEIWPFEVTTKQNRRQILTFSASSVQGCKCMSTHMHRNLDLQTNQRIYISMVYTQVNVFGLLVRFQGFILNLADLQLLLNEETHSTHLVRFCVVRPNFLLLEQLSVWQKDRRANAAG